MKALGGGSRPLSAPRSEGKVLTKRSALIKSDGCVANKDTEVSAKWTQQASKGLLLSGHLEGAGGLKGLRLQQSTASKCLLCPTC